VSENFARTIRNQFEWNVHVPQYFETVELFKGI
jgi:hypothetical protein